MNTHPPESMLIDLVAGLLEPGDVQITIEHLRGCAECERRFQVVVADYEALRATPAVLDGRIQLKHPASSRAMWPRIIVAAAIIVVVGVGVLRFANRNRLPDYWVPITQETNVLRGPEHSGVADALRAYQDRDAATAVKDLQELQPPASDNTSSTLRDLYLASALINAGRANEGLEVLDRNDIQSMPTPWRYEAEWVKYIGLRRADRDDEARSWLEKLSTEPGPNSARVQAELKRTSPAHSPMR